MDECDKSGVFFSANQFFLLPTNSWYSLVIAYLLSAFYGSLDRSILVIRVTCYSSLQDFGGAFSFPTCFSAVSLKLIRISVDLLLFYNFLYYQGAAWGFSEVIRVSNLPSHSQINGQLNFLEGVIFSPTQIVLLCQRNLGVSMP